MARKQGTDKPAEEKAPTKRRGARAESTSPGTAKKPATRSKATAGDGTAPQARSASNGGPSRDEIQKRAYEIYQRRGGRHGRDMDDWLQAERELREKQA